MAQGGWWEGLGSHGGSQSENIRRPSGRRPASDPADDSGLSPPPFVYEYQPQPQPPTPPTAEQVERVIATSGTILDQTIPMCYGVSTVRGYIGAWQYKSSVLDLGIIFAFGEQDSIATATTYINGEVITAATGVSGEAVHVGDGSTGINALLTGMDEWVAGDTTKWKSYTHACLRIDCRTSQLPGSLVFTSKLGGRKIVPIGGGGAAQSENLAVIGYDIMTSSDWAGVAAAKIDTVSWGLFEDWCNETMGDATKRYEWNGIVTERDPDRALELVLGMGLAYPYVDVSGKLSVWADMAPAAITGDWSTTVGATIEEDSLAGEATTELEVDDYVYAGSNLRRVVTIVSDDRVTLDSSLSVSGVKVRPISNVVIEKHDWVQPPAASEANLLQTPDKYRVRFQDEDNAGSHELTAQYGAGTDKIIEATLPGCASASVAKRHAETMLKVAHLQPYSWVGVVGNDVGTALEPGDVVLFSDDVLSQYSARVVPPIQARADGTYIVQFREYDPSAYSDNTAVTDTVPSLGTGYESDKDPIVTQIQTVYTSQVYDLIGMGLAGIYDGRVTVGDTGRNAIFGSNDIRLPNNIPIYGLKTGGATVEMLKMDTNDRLVLGDGSEAIYLNSTDVVLNDDVKIKYNWTTKGSIIGRYSASDEVQVGSSVDHLALLGRDYISLNLVLSDSDVQFRGWLSGTGSAATTTELPNDHDFCFWEETDTNTVSICVNDNTTIRQIS